MSKWTYKYSSDPESSSDPKANVQVILAPQESAGGQSANPHLTPFNTYRKNPSVWARCLGNDPKIINILFWTQLRKANCENQNVSSPLVFFSPQLRRKQHHRRPKTNRNFSFVLICAISIPQVYPKIKPKNPELLFFDVKTTHINKTEENKNNQTWTSDQTFSEMLWMFFFRFSRGFGNMFNNCKRHICSFGLFFRDSVLDWGLDCWTKHVYNGERDIYICR